MFIRCSLRSTDTLGAAFVGFSISCVYVSGHCQNISMFNEPNCSGSVYGLMTAQVYTYFRRYPNDRYCYKFLVSLVPPQFRLHTDQISIRLLDCGMRTSIEGWMLLTEFFQDTRDFGSMLNRSRGLLLFNQVIPYFSCQRCFR